MLLKSWAMPLASVPSASIRCESRSCCSSCRICVTSAPEISRPRGSSLGGGQRRGVPRDQPLRAVFGDDRRLEIVVLCDCLKLLANLIANFARHQAFVEVAADDLVFGIAEHARAFLVHAPHRAVGIEREDHHLDDVEITLRVGALADQRAFLRLTFFDFGAQLSRWYRGSAARLRGAGCSARYISSNAPSASSR